MKAIKFSILLAAALATAVSASANSFLPALSAVSSAELPAKAAALISQADAKNLQQTTIDVVKAAVGLNPAAVAEVVASIARTSPDMAATAAGTAVGLVPNQAATIARAAAAAAPAQAGKIVAAICRVAPNDYKDVADAVAEVVPGAGKDILNGLSIAMPQLKDLIAQVLAEYNGKVPSVSEALNQISAADNSPTTASADDSPLPRGPSVGAPPTPPSGTPVSIDPGSGGEVPSGGRGYASP